MGISRKSISRFAALSAAGLSLVLLMGSAAVNADTGSGSERRVLTVSGQGEVHGTPDQAMLSAGVVTTAHTAAAALADNSKAMNEVFATLKRAGIADKDMQTSNFSVQPQYATDKNGNTLRDITGYQVSNTVSVRVNDLAKVGPTLDALVSSGANSIGDIAFMIKDPKPLMAQARAAAVADAVARAQTLARAAGVTLGPITSINESGYSEPRPMYRMAAMAAAPAPTPIAAGEETVTAGVSITWAIR
ncbi:MAG TPA: SIMPL domain-containing protein [Rhizomicrobium sp.]